MNSKQMIKILKKNGFYIVSQNGSHIKLKNAKNNIIIVPYHAKKELAIGTEKSILKQAGLR